jgi:Flp pilus assembly protein TadG
MIRAAGGQALVEFALVLPLLLLFMFAIVFVAQIGVARLALEHGAAEGARIGSLTNDDGQIRSAIGAAVMPLERSSVRIHIDPPQSVMPRSGDPRGTLLRVELSYAVPVPLGFVGLPEVAVAGRAARVIEWKP